MSDRLHGYSPAKIVREVVAGYFSGAGGRFCDALFAAASDETRGRWERGAASGSFQERVQEEGAGATFDR